MQVFVSRALKTLLVTRGLGASLFVHWWTRTPLRLANAARGCYPGLAGGWSHGNSPLGMGMQEETGGILAHTRADSPRGSLMVWDSSLFPVINILNRWVRLSSQLKQVPTCLCSRTWRWVIKRQGTNNGFSTRDGKIVTDTRNSRLTRTRVRELGLPSPSPVNTRGTRTRWVVLPRILYPSQVIVHED